MSTSMSPIIIAVTVLLVTSHFGEVAALSCYKCSVPRQIEGEEQDLTCLKDPSKIKDSVRTCMPHQKACRTKRIDKSGKLYSFVRECSTLQQDSTHEKPPYVIYDRYCITSKCNTGNGLSSGTDDENKRITAILVDDVKASGPRSYTGGLLPTILLLASLPRLLT